MLINANSSQIQVEIVKRVLYLYKNTHQSGGAAGCAARDALLSWSRWARGRNSYCVKPVRTGRTKLPVLVQSCTAEYSNVIINAG